MTHSCGTMIVDCDNAKVGRMRVRRRDTRVWFGMLGVFTMVFLFTFLTSYYKANEEEVEAASLDGFDAGYIISDYVMGNYRSMTEADIQNFLTSKNSCKNTDYSLYQNMSSWYPNLTWYWKEGHFVCLSEELFGDGEVVGAGETAAHIIWQAAQDYRINPQVLIVLLQKEQGLITDTYPHSRQYRSATGYGCPDTAPCAAEYYGFKNQVRKAAALFRTVLDGGWTNFPLGKNYIQYNPSSECGGSVVNVRSLATSALYRYTPYQPNEGALAAGYGTAYCGAYGNRNFYLYFEDWFGGIKDECKSEDGKKDIESCSEDNLGEEGDAEEEHDVATEIKKIYDLNNGEAGILGKAKTSILTNKASGIWWQEFENGFIVGDKKHGYHVSMGPIREVWVQQNWEFGPLGFPITGILSNPASGIEWQEFENGFIVGDKKHGYHVSMGPIREVWVQQNWEFGPLGFPITGIIVDGNVEYQQFEGGKVFYSKDRGTWIE